MAETQYPEKPGLYKIPSLESGYHPDFVAITGEPGNLVAHCLYLGEVDVKKYIDGLTNVRWRFVI